MNDGKLLGKQVKLKIFLGQHSLKSKDPIDLVCFWWFIIVYQCLSSIYSNWDHHGSTNRLFADGLTGLDHRSLWPCSSGKERGHSAEGHWWCEANDPTHFSTRTLLNYWVQIPILVKINPRYTRIDAYIHKLLKKPTLRVKSQAFSGWFPFALRRSPLRSWT
jgi:hypothetical protein